MTSYENAFRVKMGEKAAGRAAKPLSRPKEVNFSSSREVHNSTSGHQSRSSQVEVSGEYEDRSTLNRSILIEEMASKPVISSLHRDQFIPRSLIEALNENASALEGGKLSLVGCSITNISDFPSSKARDIHTVYLSNNDIVSLNGIIEFQNVRNLSLGNNSVRYLGQLRILGDLNHLEKLSLEGNAVATMPFYRLSVVSLCPNLTQLDGTRITPEERKLARRVTGEIGDYFERMRLNELRLVALQHLAGKLRVHGSLHEFLRPPSEEVSSTGSYVQQMIEHHPSDAVRILVEGSVYRWLQISGADTFDCVAQDMARSLHLQIFQDLGSAHRIQLVRSPEKLWEHWQEVIEGLLQHQELSCLRLFNACEVSKGGVKRHSHDELSALAVDLGSLHALNFEEPHGEWEVEVALYGRHSRPAGFSSGGPPVGRATPAPSSTGKELATTMSERYQRLLRAKKEDIGTEADSSLAKMLPPQQSEPESPEKGPRPLHPPPTGPSAVPMSTQLSAQMLEMSGQENSVSRAHRGKGRGTGKENRAKPRRTLESTLDFSDERVVGFLNRSLNASNGMDALDESRALGRDVVAEWLHASASARSLVKLDADVPLNIRLGPCPQDCQSLTEYAPARSMTELKEQVDRALTDLTQRQRDGYMCWSISEALAKQGAKVRTIMSVAVEKGNQKMGLYYQMVGLLRDDIEMGSQWVRNVEPLLKEVQEGKEALVKLKAQMDVSEQERQKCVTLKAEQTAKKRSLLSSIHEANQALSSMSSQLRTNPNLPRRRIKKVDSILDRVEELESRSSLLMARVLRHWKFNIYKRSKTRIFYRSMWPRYRKHLKKHMFLRWKSMLRGVYTRKLVQLKAESRVVARSFSDWFLEYVCTRTARIYLKRKWARAQRRVFRMLEQLSASREREVKEVRRKDTMVTCFTMIRLFRAWKQYFFKGRLSPLEEARGKLKAASFRLRSVFYAWLRVAEDEMEYRESSSLPALRRVVDKRILHSLFVPWHRQFKARNFARVRLCLGGMYALKRHNRLGRQNHFAWMWAEQFSRHKLLYFHRKDALHALRRVTSRARIVRLAAE